MKEEAKFRIEELLGIAMTLVVLGIGAAYGITVLGDVRDDMGDESCGDRTDGFTSYNETAQQCYNSSGSHVAVSDSYFNATTDGVSATAKIPEKIPTIATVIVASVILGILVTYLWSRFK